MDPIFELRLDPGSEKAAEFESDLLNIVAPLDLILPVAVIRIVRG